jgi:hypothetical protein
MKQKLIRNYEELLKFHGELKEKCSNIYLIDFFPELIKDVWCTSEFKETFHYLKNLPLTFFPVVAVYHFENLHGLEICNLSIIYYREV